MCCLRAGIGIDSPAAAVDGGRGFEACGEDVARTGSLGWTEYPVAGKRRRQQIPRSRG